MSGALHLPLTQLAPVDGAYWEYDGFGLPTGRMMVLFEGERLPPSQHGSEWTLWKSENARESCAPRGPVATKSKVR
jgi:hypothetical protein